MASLPQYCSYTPSNSGCRIAALPDQISASCQTLTNNDPPSLHDVDSLYVWSRQTESSPTWTHVAVYACCACFPDLLPLSFRSFHPFRPAVMSKNSVLVAGGVRFDWDEASSQRIHPASTFAL